MMTGKIKSYRLVYLLLLILTLIPTLILTYNHSLLAASAGDPVVEIGDITRIEGIRENQLLGNGIVIGLAGTGDSNRSQVTVQMVANMLKNFGLTISPDQIQSRNIAAVIVTAKLPPFVHSGDYIDVTINSMGDARSLQGGTLLMTPLKAANGKVFAVAQGPISIGGFNSQQGGNQVRKNHPTVGRIPNGAIVERELDFSSSLQNLTLLLDQPNFETASHITQAINDHFKYLYPVEPIAEAVDAGRVRLNVPEDYQNNLVKFIALINNFEVRSSTEAKVVINERTGTIVMGHNVHISTVAVAHGSLTVKITTSEKVSQPPSFSEGETVVTEEQEITVSESEGAMMVVKNESTIGDLVRALNTIGATPRDVIAIIQQIKSAGALHAKLELI